MLIEGEWVNLQWVAHMEYVEGSLIIHWVNLVPVTTSRYRMSIERAREILLVAQDG